MSRASEDFLNLAVTLITHLPSTPSSTLDDTTLLQLQMIFGSMLMSALQLVDRREVVYVELPAGRCVWQVTSATGSPYTIYLSLPPKPSPPPPKDPDETTIEAGTENPESVIDLEKERREMGKAYIRSLVKSLTGMYCPCTGFAYNTLSSPRNHFCKHLLGIVLAYQMGREVKTSVNLHGAVTLLGLNRPTAYPASSDKVKMEAKVPKVENDI